MFSLLFALNTAYKSNSQSHLVPGSLDPGENYTTAQEDGECAFLCLILLQPIRMAECETFEGMACFCAALRIATALLYVAFLFTTSHSCAYPSFS